MKNVFQDQGMILDIDTRINRLLEKRTAGGLSVSEERKLWNLEESRGQVNFTRELVGDDREQAALRVNQLRDEAGEYDRMGAFELERANSSEHRRDEYLANWRKYCEGAEAKRRQARQIEDQFNLDAPEVEATTDADGITVTTKPQLELF